MLLMSQVQQFSQYHAMLSELVARALKATTVSSGTALSDEEQPSVLMAVPAARLLIAEQSSQYAALTDALRAMANIGRPWITLGAISDRDGGMDDANTAKRKQDAESSSRAYLSGTGPYPIIFRDELGHGRDVYHPLAVHLCLAAYIKHYETIPVDLWGYCEQATPEAIAPMRMIEHFTDAAPPLELMPMVLWQALCVAEQAHIFSRDADMEMIDGVVASAISMPGKDGSLHPYSPEESLDTWTYRELVGVHALANLALLRRNAEWSTRVEQIAMYHLDNTQPDNTTNQPWGVFAFLWSPKTRSFAEQQIHDATTQAAGGQATGGQGNTTETGIQPIAAMLLADAARALEAFA